MVKEYSSMREGMQMILTEDLFEILTGEVNKAKKSILIVSPYLKKKVANKIISLVKDRPVKTMLVTLPPGVEYITGATDPEAIIELQKNGFEIRMLPFLHAKIYLFDEKTLLVGSANFTNRGLGDNGESNKEILTKRKIDKADANLIMDKFWNHEEEILFKDISDFQKKVEDISEKYPDIDVQIQNAQIDFKNTFLPKITPHQKLMILMKEKGLINNFEHMKNGYYKNAFKINDNQIVKVMRSKVGIAHQSKDFDAFNYQIGEKSAELFKNRSLKALVLILEEPDQFVCLPTSFIIDKVLRKSYQGKNKDYQFKIKRDEQQLLLTVKGRGATQKRDIKKYEGDMHLRILK